MEEKRCGNPKCKRILPNDYKKLFCENCVNKGVDIFRKTIISAAVTVASIGFSVVTGGKINIKK